MRLKAYQEKAITRLLEHSREALDKERVTKIVFRSPTGSGKTITMAEFLKQLQNYSLSFIWAAPRSLHEQSKFALKKYYEDSMALDCVNFQDLTDRRIQEKQILFLNWESINRKDNNVITRENEQDFYLDKILENTKENGQRIVLIIDESHYHATTKISQDLIRDIQPDLLIEVSATPILENPDGYIKVDFEDVRLEAMIKKSIIFNDGFKSFLDGEKLENKLPNGSEDFLLNMALQKRDELAFAYKSEGISVNPLLLIQIPDNAREQSSRTNIMENLKFTLQDKHKISIDNGKLAIYLAEDKQNLENIRKNDNEVEVLIFKQAITLGWDCPRAHILALFRDWKSKVFSIQTVGRIMRMPEPTNKHYENDILNHGYIFTNIETISIREDLARQYITTNTSKRIKDYKDIKIKSYHVLRHMERVRVSSRFTELFLQTARSVKLEDNISQKAKDIELSWISDFMEQNIDSLTNKKIESDIKFNPKNEMDLQKAFDGFIINNLSPFFPQDRTVGNVKMAIYNFFESAFNMSLADDFSEIVKITLNKNNQPLFIKAIEKSKQLYIKEVQKREIEVKEREWEIPEKLNFSGDYKLLEVKKSVMEPFFYDEKWETEKAFINALENSKKIEWWYMNGNKDSRFFAVPYGGSKEPRIFYIDFIVKFTDGKIGLFDTKEGQTIDSAKEKSDALQTYINLNKNIWGGIVTNPVKDRPLGTWLYYKGESKALNPKDTSNWDDLEL